MSARLCWANKSSRPDLTSFQMVVHVEQNSDILLMIWSGLEISVAYGVPLYTAGIANFARASRKVAGLDFRPCTPSTPWTTDES